MPTSAALPGVSVMARQTYSEPLMMVPTRGKLPNVFSRSDGYDSRLLHGHISCILRHWVADYAWPFAPVARQDMLHRSDDWKSTCPWNRIDVEESSGIANPALGEVLAWSTVQLCHGKPFFSVPGLSGRRGAEWTSHVRQPDCELMEEPSENVGFAIVHTIVR
jgi:hypothetical protein